ncbi:MAG: aminoacyl-tRNA hydrolase [Gemmatimonadetes bacterium]|nr:aminoacyl-tRNA hydrolase [Gemmatimonadota bacterium]
MGATRAIVGLGNPGPDYDGTRHNVGFALVDHLAARWGFGPFRREGPTRVSRDMVRGREVWLLKPTTYMNRSGAALVALREEPSFDPATDLLVVVDEAALPVGRFRLRSKGSAGGHNGLRSVEGALQGQDYARLRIGVGPVPPDYDDMADFVLDRFEPDEARAIDELLDPAADAVETWLEFGIEIAMTRHNRTGPSPSP